MNSSLPCNAQQRSEDFLKIAPQFKLGALLTEASHPVTANLSEVAATDIAAALKLLFEADADVVKKFRGFVQSGRAEKIAAEILHCIKNNGRIFFTGCGSTGRLSILLDSVWRGFWKRGGERGLENRTVSVMAGGDFALIKSVEGFEDFTAFGKKQMTDLNVNNHDVVFAITEGGETSFVIGTAWAGVEAGAKVFFIYNNPDDILRANVERSREIIDDPRIEKINLTTGPMAITGSTRMQATSIQLCVMLTVLEIVADSLLGRKNDSIPQTFLEGLETLHAHLTEPVFLVALARLVALEEKIYRAGGKNNYFADRFGIDVLTDTTERSPTFCTPPFRKADDVTATESWAFLFLPDDWTDSAWQNILQRKPRCVEWSEDEIRALVEPEKVARTLETVGKISALELMRYKIGANNVRYRSQKMEDGAVGILSERDPPASVKFVSEKLLAARKNGSRTGLVYFGVDATNEIERIADESVFLPVSRADFLLDGLARVAVKLVMNALSTCTMVRLGRVLGNTMVYVVPSNLKLIDRATRYISRLANLDYAAANALLFEVIEYIEPRMKADQPYPPAVQTAVVRAREQATNEEAEKIISGAAGK